MCWWARAPSTSSLKYSMADSRRTIHLRLLQSSFRWFQGGFRADYTIMTAVRCPLCGERRARRACPALGKLICAVCCGTKRLVEIRCPSDCSYLASAREHPAAVVVRQQQHDFDQL